MKILYYLILTRFRKFLPKDDSTAVAIFVLAYLALAFVVYYNFDRIEYFSYLLFLDGVFYHQNRKDLELLKINKNYQLIILLEYVFYSFPFFVVLFLKWKFINILIILLVYIGVILSPKLQFKIIKYPFSLLDPYWHISFRKYKIIYWLPFIFVISYMGLKHDNVNIQYFVLCVVMVICCLPSFERERIIEINYTPYSTKTYLTKQLKNSFINTCCLAIPIALILYLNTFNLNIILFLFAIMVLPPINILLKYTFFYSPIVQQLFIVLSILGYGITLIAVPFLYKRAIRNLNEIKNAKY